MDFFSDFKKLTLVQNVLLCLNSILFLIHLYRIILGYSEAYLGLAANALFIIAIFLQLRKQHTPDNDNL